MEASLVHGRRKIIYFFKGLRMSGGGMADAGIEDPVLKQFRGAAVVRGIACLGTPAAECHTDGGAEEEIS